MSAPPQHDPRQLRLRRGLLLLVLLLGCFQAGRLSERWIWPCRLRPLAAPLAPLLGQELPDPALCRLLLSLPGS